MPATASFTFENLATEILRGIIETVAERHGDTEAQRFSRHQTTVFSVMAFLPRDALEMMLAGQCVLFDHLLADGARDLLRGQEELIKLRVRPQLTAIGNMFLKHLAQLIRLQARPADRIAQLPRATKPEAEAGETAVARPAAANAQAANQAATGAAARPRPEVTTARAHPGPDRPGAPAHSVQTGAAAMGDGPAVMQAAAASAATAAQEAKVARLGAILPDFAPPPRSHSLAGPDLMDRALADPACAKALAAATHGPAQPVALSQTQAAKRCPLDRARQDRMSGPWASAT
jgi:hypothetical protein